MSRKIRSAAVGALALFGLAATTANVQAMPVQDLAPAASAASGIDKAYVVCGPWRCVHRGWGWRRPYYGWGWRHPYYGWGWHRWGWHRPWGWRRW